MDDTHRDPDPGEPASGPVIQRAPRDDANESGAVSREPASDNASVFAFFRELPVLLLIAFFLAFLLRTFVVQVFFIPSESMKPTLQVDDRMVVEKISYRVGEPKRGEIVVFEGPSDTVVVQDQSLPAKLLRGAGQFLGVVPESTRDFVKRVIGVPGDMIRVEGETVYVNGVAIDEPYVEFNNSPSSSSGPFEVPEGTLFFLGDNRPNSADSRFGMGYVEMDRVVGRAVLLIWPFSHGGIIHNPDYGDIPAGDHAPAGDEGATDPPASSPDASVSATADADADASDESTVGGTLLDAVA